MSKKTEYFTVGYRGLNQDHDTHECETLEEALEKLMEISKGQRVHLYSVAFWQEDYLEDVKRHGGGFYCTWRYSGDDFLKLRERGGRISANGGMYPTWVCDHTEPSTWEVWK